MEAREAVRAAARTLILEDERNALYNANRLARIAALKGDPARSAHWMRVAAECCRVSDCEMDRAALARAVQEVDDAWAQGREVGPL